MIVVRVTQYHRLRWGPADRGEVRHLMADPQHRLLEKRRSDVDDQPPSHLVVADQRVGSELPETADRQQPHRCAVAPGPRAGAGNAVLDRRKIGAECRKRIGAEARYILG